MSPSRSTSPVGFWANHLSPQLNRLWRGRWRAGTVEPARYLYDHELVLVTEGACTVQIEDVRHELGIGQYVIIPPDTYHVTTTRRGVYRNCIHFDWKETPGKKAHPLCSYYPERPKKSAVVQAPSFVPRRYFAGEFLHTATISSLVETLFHRWQTGEQVAQALGRATFLELLVVLMNPPGLKTRASNVGFEHACAVRDLLDQQGESTDGIQDLLGKLGFSYPHLCRLFRKAFGITPIEYRNALRLERAKALLLNPKLTIAEVAYAVGFRDAGYFSRQFRRQNGASPRDVRQSSAAI
jgi:AraC-like DNA-binding protein